MGNLVFQATLGGQVNLVGPNTASTYNINVPAVAGNMVTTGDTGTVTSTMLASSVYTAPGTIGSGTPNTGAFTTLTLTNALGVAYGGTNATSFTGKSGNVAGLVFFDGTKLTNDATVTDVGYDTSTNTVKANNLSISGTQTYADGSTQNTAATGFGFKNRIINGAMMIDQRNAGASVTNINGGVYSLDRWQLAGAAASKYTAQQSTTVPTSGFKNSLVATSLSAYTVGTNEGFTLRQNIEGFNVADLNWGTSAAATVTLSFWVRSSLTGTFGGSLINNGFDRSYPFSYTISAANTWEQKSVMIAGDQSGTWTTDNTAGIRVLFGLGVGSGQSATAGTWAAGNYQSATGATSVVGTNGATFYITGVQLEKGSTATSFDYRPYGTELALCQRYYYRVSASASAYLFGQSFNSSTVLARGVVNFPVTMRTEITSLEQSGTAADYQVAHGNLTATACSSVPTFSTGQKESCAVNFTVASGLTAGNGSLIRAASSSAYLGFSAEL